MRTRTSWAFSVGAVAAAVASIALVSSCDSDSGSRQPQTPKRAPQAKRAVTLKLAQLKHAQGAFGSVTVRRSGAARLGVTIDVAVPRARAGVALWSSRRHWKGLYAVYPGRNTQTASFTPAPFLSYRWLVVAQQVITQRVVKRRIGRRVFRVRQQSVKRRMMLRIPTAELANALVGTTP